MKQKKMRILVVSFIFPYPLTGGGSRDIYPRIKFLKEKGYNIDLVATSKDKVSDLAIASMKKLVDDVKIVYRSSSVSDLISCIPFQCSSRGDLSKIKFSTTYDIVILETEYVGEILKNKTLCSKKIILRLHNNEKLITGYHFKSANGILRKIAFIAEYFKIGRYSAHIAKQCDQLWFISDKEYKSEYLSLKSCAHSVKRISAPLIVEKGQMKEPILETNIVFYVGTLNIEINYEGILWYLKNVHPKLFDIHGYKFVLAGKATGAIKAGIERLVSQFNNVVFDTQADEISEYYAQAGAFINPIQRGAGVKIKTVDAIVEGLPVVTTNAGAEGIGIKHNIHAIITDDAYEYAQGIRKVLADKEFAKKMVLSAQDLLKEKNTGEPIVRALLELDA